MKNQFALKLMAIALATAMLPLAVVAESRSKTSQPNAAPTDSRVQFVIFNHALTPYDVRIEDHIYVIQPRHVLNIAAPTGTEVYAAMDMATYKDGELLRQLKSRDRNKMLVLF